jgi:tryptophan synthase alpha chain
MLTRTSAQKRAAFIPFLVAGYPSLEATEKMIDILVEEGADLLELGVPFSDALADGPVIQAASEQASRTVSSIDQVIDLAAKVKKRHPKLSIILFTYFNPIFKLGIENFAKKTGNAGVAGVLVVDLPPEESFDYQACMKAHDVKTVYLASPTTTPERIPVIAEASTGFIYYVSRTGVTGVQSELSQSLEKELKHLRSLTDRPIAVGFGISKGEHAKVVAKLGDAVVVGSAFVKLMTTHQGNLSRMSQEVRALARELVAAMNQ